MNALLLLTTLALHAAPAADAPEPVARFALIVGVNHAVDRDLPPLRYADDDAAKYQDLFRALGVRTYLLTRLDAASQRLFPQQAAEARPPVSSELRAAVAAIAADVTRSRERGVRTELYVVYAGHGNVRDGLGYVALEDERLTARSIATVVLDGIAADRAHVIVDACYSYFLAYGRGPGGRHRSLEGFTPVPELAARADLGLLLSTSTAKESHEWEGFQSGVFSHEVRSALYGAADADGDGQVTYREVAAFVARANESIANERYRPEVLARPPRDEPPLVDLRSGLSRRIELPGSLHGRLSLEDARGVRLVDLHRAAGEATALVRPPASGRLYLHARDAGVEYELPPQEVVAVAQLTPGGVQVASRGAAHEAFSSAFALPFGTEQVAAYALPPPPRVLTMLMPTAGRHEAEFRTRAGIGALVGAVLLGFGGVTALSFAAHERNPVIAPSTPSLREAQLRRASTLQTAGTGMLVGAGAAAVVGAFLLLIPEEDSASSSLSAAPVPGGLTLSGTF